MRGEIAVGEHGDEFPAPERREHALDCLAEREDLAWTVVGVGDLNGDGASDIVWQHQSTGAVYVWFLNGLTRSAVAWVLHSASGEGAIASAADFTRDGKLDLLWQDGATGDVRLSVMNGAAESYRTTIQRGVVDPTWRIVGPK